MELKDEFCQLVFTMVYLSCSVGESWQVDCFMKTGHRTLAPHVNSLFYMFGSTCYSLIRIWEVDVVSEEKETWSGNVRK